MKETEKPKSRKGFASMDPARHREICAMGGKAAQASGNAHNWTSEEAREAGRKGGKTISADSAHMANIGRKGGRKRGEQRALETEKRGRLTEKVR